MQLRSKRSPSRSTSSLRAPLEQMRSTWSEFKPRVPAPRLSFRNDRGMPALFPAKRKRSPSPEAIWTVVGVAAAAGVVWAYRSGFQSWHRTWGAREEEVEATIPGDELVHAPTYLATRALTIDRPPEDVWPHLLQIGRRFGKLYMDHEVASDQKQDGREGSAHRDIGDLVKSGPAPWIGKSGLMQVVELVPRRAIVFGSMDETLARRDDHGACRGTWAFVLEPRGEEATRLIVRTRSRPSLAMKPLVQVYDAVHFLRERSLLLRIKEAVEMSTSTREKPSVRVA